MLRKVMESSLSEKVSCRGFCYVVRTRLDSTLKKYFGNEIMRDIGKFRAKINKLKKCLLSHYFDTSCSIFLTFTNKSIPHFGLMTK